MIAGSHRPSCYVANPYGFAEGTKHWYDTVLLPMLSNYVEVLDPWSVDVSAILEASPEDRPHKWLDLGDYHYRTIKHQSQLLIALLDQEPPDNGTVCEVVWAAAHGIPVIGYRNDLRTSGEEGLPFNLMVGAAIRISGGIRVSSIAELEAQLPNFLRDIVH